MIFYDANTDRIISSSGIPNDITLANGTALFGSSGLFNAIGSGLDVFSNAGYYFVANDTPSQPSGTVEDVDSRVISYSGVYANITRTWVSGVESVPEVITPRQMRLWLYDNGTTAADVEVVINNIADSGVKEKTLIEWEYATFIERFHPMVVEIGSGLGLSSGDINTAFIEASRL